ISSGDDITCTAATLDLANGADLTVTTVGGNVSADGGIRGNSSEDVTIDAGAGTVSVGAIGNLDEINTVAVTGSTVTLRGNITTSNAAGNTVTLTGNVALAAANLTIDTDNATNDGDVSITGTVNADNVANDRTLSITAG